MLVGAGGFFGGMQYQKSQRGNFAQFANGGRFLRANGAAGGNTNITPVRGQIISSDANSITVKLQNGSSKIVVVPSSASITEATSSSKEALTNGQTVLVLGTSNSDGSVTAQDIQLNPRQFRMGGGGGG